jgi:hypothetical protein
MNAPRRLASVLYCCVHYISRFICVKYGALWRLRDARRRISCFGSIGITWPICAKKMVSCGGVATLGFAMLGVVFPFSCSMASSGSPVVNIASFCSVVTLGLGLLASVLPRLYWLHLQFVVGVAANSVATLGVVFPTSLPVTSRGSSSLTMVFWLHRDDWRPEDIYWLHLRFGVGVSTIGVAMLDAGFQLCVRCHPKPYLR